MTGYSALLVDDHPLFAEGVQAAFARLDASIRIEWARSLEQGIERLSTESFGLVLLDLRLPGANGLAAFLAIRGSFPQVRIAVLSGTLVPGMARELISLGAHGVMSKDLSSEILVNAVRLIRDGGLYVPPSLLTEIAATGLAATTSQIERRQELTVAARARLKEGGASTQEIRVAELMTQGQSNKEIARNLGLQEGTVKVYVSAILRILRVNNRVKATLALHE